jgi:hypothetical protein
MQYTKPMVDLVYEIRRRVDAAVKPSVKMANPDALNELADYYQKTKDNITKALIKELLYMAGPEWAMLLEPAKSEPTKALPPRQVVKVYRGQTILQATEQDPNTDEEKPLGMYRGNPTS